MRGRKSKVPDESAPNRIREWRLRRGLTIEQLAERMQSNSQTVHRHETGSNEMTLARLERYAETLSVRVEELLSKSHRVPEQLRTLVELAEKLAPDERARLIRLGHALAEPQVEDDGDPLKATRTS